MAAEETAPTVTTSQITTNDLNPPAAPVAPEAPVSSVEQPAGPLYSPQGPDPGGTEPQAAEQMRREQEQATAAPQDSPGIEGEQIVWEARYAMKNFIGRVVGRSLATVAWIGLAVYAWEYNNQVALRALTIVLGVVLLLFWLGLIYRIVYARYGHYYRLTTRRLFVSTGLMQRRRDQLELLRIKDVFTRQRLTERWLTIGTVVVVPDDAQLPTFYLAGVDDPKGVMDLVWHHSRAQREGKTVQVDHV